MVANANAPSIPGAEQNSESPNARLEALASNPLQAAAAVAKVVDLKEVQVVALEARMHMPPEAFLNVNHRWRISKPTITSEHIEGTNVLTVLCTIAVTATEARSSTNVIDEQSLDQERGLIMIRATMRLVYVLAAPPPPAEFRRPLFDSFATLNGIHNAWPYLRETVQSMTSRMGIPPFTLPTFRVPRQTENAKLSQKSPS